MKRIKTSTVASVIACALLSSLCAIGIHPRAIGAESNLNQTSTAKAKRSKDEKLSDTLRHRTKKTSASNDDETVQIILQLNGPPSGKLKSVPFLFKFDMPVEWVGEHEEYGNYDSIISKIEWEFREPMLPNFLRSVVFSELSCQGESVPFCEQLKLSGIELPADGPAAEALVMDQIEDAMEITNREWPDIAAVVEVAEQGPEWWNDSRIPLLALPRVTTCISENRCAAFINMELAIDLLNGGP